MVAHTLKILPKYFREVVAGNKTFEIRSTSDRDFVEGERVKLREFDGKNYTGQEVIVEIMYVTGYEQKNWNVVFSHRIISMPNNPKLNRKQPTPDKGGARCNVEGFTP